MKDFEQLKSAPNIMIGEVSPYPPRKTLHSGVEFYTKDLAISLKKLHVHIICFADGRKDEYLEKGIKVIRCWKRGVCYPFSIFSQLSKYASKIDLIHVQHEYFMYGNEISAVLFPFMLLLLKFLRKPIVVTLHGIVPLTDLNKTFMKENRIKGASFILKAGLLFVTKLICWFSSRIIVHEEVFKKRLVRGYKINKEKIEIIPLGIENRSPIRREKAKMQLRLEGKKILLYFGYIAGYKGVEDLIDAFKLLKSNKYVLLIAGGEPTRLKFDKRYQYLKKLKEKCAKISKNIIFMGFVPEEKIPLLFSAADLAVFPYKVALSSSGPMSLAVAYELPFIASKCFEEIIDNELLFKDSFELAEKIDQFFDETRDKNLKYIKKLKKERLWSRIASKTYKLYQRIK